MLSLQSPPRRLSLDFRDVFSEGFAFDFVRGDMLIDQGVASTNNLQMKGVNAAVLMEGKADIEKETQDLRVVVVPEINAMTASLVATAINPVVGLGSFLAQVFLRGPPDRGRHAGVPHRRRLGRPRVVRVPRRGREATAPRKVPAVRRRRGPQNATPEPPAPETPHDESRCDPDGVWPRPETTWPPPAVCWNRRRRPVPNWPCCPSTSAPWACAIPTSSPTRRPGARAPSRASWPALRANWGCGLWAAPCPAHHRPQRVRNTTLVFAPDGRCVARYDKIHLFWFDNGREQFHEGRVIEAGDNAPVQFDLPARDGHRWRVGLSVCYDLRFPELFPRPCPRGCGCVAGAQRLQPHVTGQAHWEVLLRARAIENLAYVVAPPRRCA